MTVPPAPPPDPAPSPNRKRAAKTRTDPTATVAEAVASRPPPTDPTPSGPPPPAGEPADAGRDEQHRRRKLERIAESGIPLWPNRFDATHTPAEAFAVWGALDAESLHGLPESDRQTRVAGRIIGLRSFGKAAFVTLAQGSETIQAHLRRDVLDEREFRLSRLLDLGDWIGVAGPVFRTRKGEFTVRADRLTFLAKAILPPPEKYHGLTDRAQRYRKRYLDLLANEETRRIFERRAAMVRALRRFLDAEGFLEVETPMLQPLATGAAARPFTTHHRSLDLELFLRVAPELYLKRLVVGGFPRVYEINRNFRNEGLSTRHNPEFTMLECYRAFSDAADMMALTEGLVADAAARVLGGEPARFGGAEIRFEVPFARLSLTEVTAEALAGRGLRFDPRTMLDDPGPLADAHRRLELEPPPEGTAGKLLVSLFEALAEKTLIQPAFVTGYPLEVSPLSKADPGNPGFTERFELFIGGMEIANGFSELNDPDEQAARFGEQMARRQEAEAHAMDWDYIEALRHGLPPTGGVGVGVDRLAMLFTGAPAIRDVILFPHLRPRSPQGPSPK